MKCHKCGYNSFDFLERCKKCGSDLSRWKKDFGITSLVMPAGAPAAEPEDPPEKGSLPQASLQEQPPTLPPAENDLYDLSFLRSGAASPAPPDPIEPIPSLFEPAAAPFREPQSNIIDVTPADAVEFLVEKEEYTVAGKWPEVERFGRNEEPDEKGGISACELTPLEEVTKEEGEFTLTVDLEFESLLQRSPGGIRRADEEEA